MALDLVKWHLLQVIRYRFIKILFDQKHVKNFNETKINLVFEKIDFYKELILYFFKEYSFLAHASKFKVF